MSTAQSAGLVLASSSQPRARMLAAAGVPCEVDPAHLDEDEIKAAFRAEGASVLETAEALAESKALAVSRRRPGRLVLGADQMLELEGRWFDKPPDRAAARVQLQALSGRTHRLVTVAVCAQDGRRLWHVQDEARLTMRPLGDAFIDDYLEEVGDLVCQSVGAYQLEGLGAQLFAKVEGDFFTVLGLPLLPVLAYLRDRRLLPV